MKKVLALILLALLGGACQLLTTTTPTTLPPTQQSDALTATTAPTPTTPPTAQPSMPLEDILAQLPFTQGFQPNGRIVVHETQQADLTGDGREDFIIITGWKQDDIEEFATLMQVDIFSATGEHLYTRNTWEVYGESPSTAAVENYPLLTMDRIEVVDIVSLTGDIVPEVVVRIRYSGTGSILEAHILSFKDGITQALEDIIAYKGWMEYGTNDFTVSQPLYLYNEPNCCPCRMETVTYAWDGANFAVADTLREAITDTEGCPAFPTPAEWRALTVTGTRPPARRDAALIYDTRRERLLLFGGRAGTSAFDDTWAFDLNTLTWTESVPLGAPRPPARYSMVAGFDAMRDRLIITTGEARSGVFFNDVWALDLQTDTWTQQFPSGTPPPARYGAAGGIAEYGDTLALMYGCADQNRFDDTWLLELDAMVWRNVTPGGKLPLKRCLHSAAPLGWTQLALFGGCSSPVGPCPQGSTWILDLLREDWQPLSGPEPAPRQYSSMTALSDRNAVLLFSGLGANNIELGDAWILSPHQGGWRQLLPGQSGPSARQGHSMTTVSFSSLTPGAAAVVFGGLSDGTLRNDLWVLIPWDE